MHSSAIVQPTDQVRCYGQDGQTVPCQNSGQDASFKKKVPPTAPRRFDHKDQVVRDTLTGAVWTRDANIPEFPLTWDEARQFVAEMRGRQAYGYEK